jgi:hypothetical protein
VRRVLCREGSDHEGDGATDPLCQGAPARDVDKAKASRYREVSGDEEDDTTRQEDLFVR